MSPGRDSLLRLVTDAGVRFLSKGHWDLKGGIRIFLSFTSLKSLVDRLGVREDRSDWIQGSCSGRTSRRFTVGTLRWTISGRSQ